MTALAWLTCPSCGAPLRQQERRLACEQQHSFDLARQGYVNLLGHSAPSNADTAAMLDARSRFLSAGHYLPIADAVAGLSLGALRILEVGAGTGYYLAAALDASPGALGLASDVSTAAAKRAARCHPRAACVVADTWAGLPLPEDSVDSILCVFAPRNPAEFARILRPGGTLVVALPTAEHLIELRCRYQLLGLAPDKSDRLLAAFPDWTTKSRRLVHYRAGLSSSQVRDLIAMGPNAFHGVPAEIEPAEVTVSVDVRLMVAP